MAAHVIMESAIDDAGVDRPCPAASMMRLLRAVLIVWAFGGVSVGWGTSPGHAAAGPPRWANVHYGPATAQAFDLWLPAEVVAPAPVVIIFHGGGFITGDKQPCLQEMIAGLLEHGIAAVCANYRLAPEATYPAQMEDGGRVIQWLRAHAQEYRIDRDRIGLMGTSAGGALSLWLAFHADLALPSAADPVSRESTRVVAVVTSNAQATYDPQTIEQVFGTRNLPQFVAALVGAGSVDRLWEPRFSEIAKEASPVTYLHAGGPPVLAYYTSDAGPSLPPNSEPQAYVHHPAQGDYLQRVAAEKGVDLTVHSGHYYPSGWAGFLDAAVAFFRAAFRS